MAKLLTYEQKDTWMDRLCGVTKLIYFLAWSITSMLTYDTRVLAVMLVLSLILFKILMFLKISLTAEKILYGNLKNAYLLMNLKLFHSTKVELHFANATNWGMN